MTSSVNMKQKHSLHRQKLPNFNRLRINEALRPESNQSASLPSYISMFKGSETGKPSSQFTILQTTFWRLRSLLAFSPRRRNVAFIAYKYEGSCSSVLFCYHRHSSNTFRTTTTKPKVTNHLNHTRNEANCLFSSLACPAWYGLCSSISIPSASACSHEWDEWDEWRET